MSYFGISQTHWDDARNQPEEVKLHRSSKQEDPHLVGFDEGRAATPQDIAGLLHRGDEVWTIVPDERNFYVATNRVSVRGRTKSSLYSYDGAGRPSESLACLPRY
jgi:hypothetical protein